jgi:hypothetical protein
MRSLLDGIVDYAGLFPPAGLTMLPAVRNYSAYRAGADAWALGRFVVPVGRLEEFEAASQALLPEGDAAPWRLAALGAPDADPHATVDRILAFNARHAGDDALGRAVIDALEIRASSTDDVAAIADALHAASGGLRTYVEVPLSGDPRLVLDSVRIHELRAKVRTGGVTPDLFPSPDALLRFIAHCAMIHLPFKATAGLHHPLRAEYPLTYEPDCASGTMYGYLNVFLAAAFLRAELPNDRALELLAERDASSLQFDDAGVTWRGHHLSTEQVAATRAFAISFGSCSFTEPLSDARALGLL